MGFAAFHFQFRAIFGAEFQRGAIIDRRALHCDLALAAAIEFVRAFVTGIEMAAGFEFLGGLFVFARALDLAREKIVSEAEPVQIFEDRRFVFGLGALGVGIVDAQ